MRHGSKVEDAIVPASWKVNVVAFFLYFHLEMPLVIWSICSCNDYQQLIYALEALH